MLTHKAPLTFISAILLAAALHLTAAAAPFLNTEPITGVGPFFDTPTGTVAFIPGVSRKAAAKLASEFLAFPANGAYTLPKTPTCWFIVNHHGASADVTYLGVQIAKIMPAPVDEHLYLYRNRGWSRTDVDNFSSDELERLCNVKPEQFTSLHRQLAGLEDIQKIDALRNMEDHVLQRVRWHGIPDGAQIASWEKAIKWRKWTTFDEPEFRASFGLPLPENYDVLLDNRLLRFEARPRGILEKITNAVLPTKPLVFDLTPGPALAIYVRTFVPDQQGFDKEFFFTLAQED